MQDEKGKEEIELDVRSWNKKEGRKKVRRYCGLLAPPRVRRVFEARKPNQ